PDRALRPARNEEPAFAIERHAIGMARRMDQRLGADAGRPFVDRVADNVGPQKALLAPVPHRTLAEIEAVRDLVEPQVWTRDALESRRGKIDVHETPLLPGFRSAYTPPSRRGFEFFAQHLVPRGRAAGRIGDAAAGAAQPGDARHLVLAQHEIEHVNV